MSQVEARALKKKNDPKILRLKKILRQMAIWAFPSLALLLLALSGFSYLGDRGASDLELVKEKVAEEQALVDEKQELLTASWSEIVEASTGVPLADLDLVKFAEPEILDFVYALPSDRGKIPSNYEFQGFNPVLRSISETGDFKYVVILEWLPTGDDDAFDKESQSGKVLEPYFSSDGFIEGSGFKEDHSRTAIVWFSIVEAEDGSSRKQLSDIDGFWSIGIERSKI